MRSQQQFLSRLFHILTGKADVSDAFKGKHLCD